MRLIALELENFRQYAHAQVSFDTGITSIVGANGAGKSTLVEAILWALYGARALREGTDTVRFFWSEGGSPVRVQLDFELGARRYQIVRTLKDSWLAQYTNSGWTPIARGTSSINSMVPKLLGMNLLQFQTSFCARQKELEFMRYAPDKRREEISRMLGYERIRTVIDSLKQQSLALRAEVTGLMQGIGDSTALERDIERTQATLQQLEQDIQDLTAQWETAKQEEVQTAQQFAILEARKQTYQSLLARKQLLENDRKNLAELEAQLKQEWNAIQRAQERCREIQPEAKTYKEVQERLRTYEQLALYEQKRIEINATLQGVNQHLEQLTQQRTQLQQKQQEREALQSALDQYEDVSAQLRQVRLHAQQASLRAKLESEVEHLHQRILQLTQQQEAYSALQAQIQHQREGVRQIRQAQDQQEAYIQHLTTEWQQGRTHAVAELRSHEAHIERIAQRKQQLESLGAETACPTCGQPLGPVYGKVLQQVRAELREAEQRHQRLLETARALEAEPQVLTSAKNRLQEIVQDRERQTQELTQLEQQAKQLENPLQELPQLQREIEQKQRALEAIPLYDPEQERTLTEQLNALQPAYDKAQQLQGELKQLPQIEREIVKRERERQRLLNELQKLPAGYDAQQHEQLRQQEMELRPLYEEFIVLSDTLKKKELIKTQIRELRQRQQENQRNLQQVEEDQKALHYSDQEYESMRTAHESAKQHVERLSEVLNQRRSDYNATQQLLESFQRRIEEIRQRKQELEKKQRETLFYETLHKAMQSFQKELNTRLRPMLANYASEFLNALTGGRYTEIEIDEQFGFYLIDENVRKTVISGGEEDVVNLSLRLALARLITEKAGQPLSLLILDEVFGSLDTERRANVLNLLNSLRDWFEQILVISHIEEINESADRCLYVVRDEHTRTSRIYEKLDRTTLTEAIIDPLPTPQDIPLTLFPE